MSVKRYTGKVLLPYDSNGPLAGQWFESSLTEVVSADDHDAEIAARDARIAELERTLAKYGDHMDHCLARKIWGDYKVPCTCGFTQVLSPPPSTEGESA